MKLKRYKSKYQLFGRQPGYVQESPDNASPCPIELVTFTPTDCRGVPNTSLDQAFTALTDKGVNWIIGRGIPSSSELATLGNRTDLHRLELEAIQNCGGMRPGIISDAGHLSIVVRFPLKESGNTDFKMVSLFIVCKGNTVITFQTENDDLTAPLLERIKSSCGKIRQKSSDYLVYALLDLVTDYYFLFLESITEGIEQLEKRILENPGQELLVELQSFKLIGSSLRKNVWPFREMIRTLNSVDYDFMLADTEKYFQELERHLLSIIDNAESCREQISDLLELYLSNISNRMNEVMKTLTLIATIFIPLTFIAGIYGMNFEYMPELKWHNGYFMAIGLMTFIAMIMAVYFKRKKWL